MTIVFLALLYFVLRNIKVQKITCESQYGKCSTDILVGISKLQNTNIFNARSGVYKLLKDSPIINNYSVNFIPPLNLAIYVLEKKPIVAFVLKDGSFAEVDKEGNVIGNVRQTTLPKITSIELSNEQRMYAANLISKLYLFYKVNSAKITQDGIEVGGINGKSVIFPLSGDSDVLLGALNLIISRLPSVKEASTIGTIDLRFKNPVLR